MCTAAFKKWSLLWWCEYRPASWKCCWSLMSSHRPLSLSCLLKKIQAYPVTRELISVQFVLTAMECVHRSLGTWGYAVPCVRHLPSLELWAELWEEAEVFWAKFGLTECTCAQIHAVSAPATSGCLIYSSPLWGGWECEEIKFSLCLFSKYTFLSWAMLIEVRLFSSALAAFYSWVSFLWESLTSTCVWSILGTITVF